MTHPALACLTLAGIRNRGGEARRKGLPYLGSNPFVGDDSIEPLEEWATKCMAWNAGWLEEDRGRSLEVLRWLRAELPWLAAKSLLWQQRTVRPHERGE